MAKHADNAKKNENAFTTLTTDGNFEKVAGADGKISLKEAQDYLKNHPDGPLADALKVLTTNGTFENVAGGTGKDITLKQLQDAREAAHQEYEALFALVTFGFVPVSEGRGKITYDDAQKFEKSWPDSKVTPAVQWLLDGDHFKQTANDP